MQNSILEKLSVLVVDDSALVRNMVRNVLKTINVTHVKDAANGRQAYAALQTRQYSLIICDWHMPEMEGIELLKKIRADERLKNIPFLMLTSDVSVENVKEAIQSGVTEYLTKPFTTEQILEKLARLIAAI